MPELPEVETVARRLLPHIKGRRILSIEVLRAKNLDCPLEEFIAGVSLKTFDDVKRRGKHLIFVLKEGGYIISHLRMEGRYFFEDEESEKRKHDILYYHLDGGKRLAYCDTRKFGRLSYCKDDQSLALAFSSLGPEPFSFSPHGFFLALHPLKKKIKEAIMNQSVIAGIGNIYADEALFASFINPLTLASSLSEEECALLLENIKRLLLEAIKQGGSTIRSYHPEEGVSGSMQRQLKCYAKGGQPCPRCGCKLKRIALNGRGTTYCPLCQREKNKRFVVGISGPIHSGKSTFASFLVKKGYLLFDADKEARALYNLKKVKRKLSSLFPSALKENGEIDFPALRLCLSSSPESKAKLNAIIFPLVKEKAASFIAKCPQKGKIVLDVPLLLDAKMDELCEVIILLEANEKQREERLEKEGRDARSLLKINEDYPLLESEEIASILITNDGSEEELKAKEERLFSRD
jgi:formamidopyrimidine-DNA glycosylase